MKAPYSVFGGPIAATRMELAIGRDSDVPPAGALEMSGYDPRS
jgi:hypothetical protein